MDRNLALEFVRVTEAAAISASRWVGKGDKKAADQAATSSMRKNFSSLDIDGTVVIGEGERDEAPMLFIGEKVGNGKGLKVDIAVDPLEGTNPTASGGNNSITVLAAAPSGNLLRAPDTYMDKIAVGPKAVGVVDLDASPKKNITQVAKKLGKNVGDMTIVIMDRDRHKKLIAEVRKLGARIRLIGDGDVSGAIAPSIEDSGIDMLMGIGAAPEGVLAAAALKTLGGEIQGRLKFRNDEERKRAKEMGFLDDLDKKLMMDDMVKGDRVMFAATGVTDGELLRGVRFTSQGATTHSIVMRKLTGTVRFVEAQHDFKRKPGFKKQF
jgi:fructose-1,6-bisphosphatase II|tara:strand:+ start:932 stop:1903 length:972 start_codon:yes stop_codon:yes gene_type:complete